MLIELDEKSLYVYKGKRLHIDTFQLSKVKEINTKKLFLNRSVILKIEATDQEKDITYRISSDQIKNSELLKLSEEIRKIKRIV